MLNSSVVGGNYRDNFLIYRETLPSSLVTTVFLMNLRWASLSSSTNPTTCNWWWGELIKHCFNQKIMIDTRAVILCLVCSPGHQWCQEWGIWRLSGDLKYKEQVLCPENKCSGLYMGNTSSLPWDAWLFLHANNGDYRLISLTLATPTTQRSIIIADRAHGIAGRKDDRTDLRRASAVFSCAIWNHSVPSYMPLTHIV